jgi:hypothetical protein
MIAQPPFRCIWSDGGASPRKLCTVDGPAFETVPLRDKAAYDEARRLRWGEISNTRDTNTK